MMFALEVGLTSSDSNATIDAVSLAPTLYLDIL